MPNRRRVVITGLGLITPIGNNPEKFWQNLIRGQSGIGKIDRFDVSTFPTQIAAQVKDFDPADYIPKKDARRMDKFVQYACAAAKSAWEDSGLSISAANASRMGVWIGSGVGGLETLENQCFNYVNKGAAGISPFLIPMMIPNMAAGQVAIMLGAMGPNGCTVTACASGTNSIGDALEIIRHGKADVMIAGGAESSISTIGIGGFCAMKALSTRNDELEKACQPFDANRAGFVMGEGSGIVVLEELEHALARKANIYAELVGYGYSGDAYHMVQPDEEGQGAGLAFKMALRDADIKPEVIDYINAHGTGTKLNDKVETTVIKQVFGEYSKQIPISSIKAATGHMLGAAGAVELIAALLAIKYNLIPPTLNYSEKDPDCDLDYVPNEARSKKVNYILSDSLGFGGHNAVLIAKEYPGGDSDGH